MVMSLIFGPKPPKTPVFGPQYYLFQPQKREYDRPTGLLVIGFPGGRTLFGGGKDRLQNPPLFDTGTTPIGATSLRPTIAESTRYAAKPPPIWLAIYTGRGALQAVCRCDLQTGHFFSIFSCSGLFGS